jgi:hypothetical protein
MEPLLAYHGDQKIKHKYLRRLAAHRRADELAQGVGWETNGVTKGCAVGCTLDVYDHSLYPIELGIPEQLAHLEDAIFEALPRKEAMEWPQKFLRAITVGADLSNVWPQFAIWMLADPKHGVRRLVIGEAPWANQVRAAIDGVVELYAHPRSVGAAAWAAARAAAREAAWAAAWAAAREAAAWAAAAWAAARAAAWAAKEAAAWAGEAGEAWAAKAAASARWYRAASEELLRLLKETR